MKEKTSSTLRSAAGLSVVAGLGMSLLTTVGAAPAWADPVQATFDYKCTYPLVGTRDLKVTVKTDIPKIAEVDHQLPAIWVETEDVISADTTDGLDAIGAKTLEGYAQAAVTVNQPGAAPLKLNVDQTLTIVPVPESGAFSIKSVGKVNTSPAFLAPGDGNVMLGDLTLKVTPKKADGKPTGMGTFNVLCKQAAGESKLMDFKVVETPVTYPEPVKPNVSPLTTDKTVHPATKLNYDLNLKGETFVKAPNGTAPLDGKISVEVDGATGAITGPLTLAPTKGNFKILGFLPVTADIAFEQVGPTVGKYASGEIDTTSTMFVKLASFKAFGAIPVGGGANCKTKEASKIDMHSKRGVLFNPRKGGDFVSDDYPLSGIVDCGPLNGIIGAFTGGKGNTITAKLTPQ